VVVALGLFAMAALVAVRIGWISVPAIAGFVPAGIWFVAGIFLLRAIGDFHYIGFFKQVRDSRFARLDTLVYSPLCLLLASLILFS
jgi:hypothetical protein